MLISLLFLAGYDHTIRYVDSVHLHSIPDSTHIPQTPPLHPSPPYLVISLRSCLSRFWEALSGICSRTIPHPDSQVNRLCISPDKRFLAAAGHHTVKLYDIKSSNPNAILTFDGH